MARESIVVLGSVGAGKTLFVAALVKVLQEGMLPGAILNPQNRAAHQYVEQIWKTLREGELPAGTIQGQRTELIWILQLPELPAVSMQILDTAGQDYREIFEDNPPEGKEVPLHLQGPFENCRSATLAVLLVDVAGQFIGERKSEVRDERELALKFALDFYRKRNVPCCLVLTKWDQAKTIAGDQSPREFIGEHLPLVNKIHLQDGVIPVFPVSAVNKWKVELSGDGGDARLVADPSFASDGFHPFVGWLAETIKERVVQANFLNMLKWGGKAIGLLLMLWMGYSWMMAPPALRPPSVPQPVITNSTLEYDNSYLLYPNIGIVTGTLTNQGSSGSVTVIAIIDKDGTQWRGRGSYFVESGRSYTFEIPVKTSIDVRQPGVRHDAQAQ